MKLRRTALVLICAMLAAPALGGCASETDGGGGIVTPSPDAIRVEVVGGSERRLSEGVEHEIEFRIVKGTAAEPVQGVIDFELEGDVGGASLSGHSAPTDEHGHATVTLRSGVAAQFDLVASAEVAEVPAVVRIRVERMRFGALDYVVRYDGMRDVTGAEVALFTNVTCSDLARAVPTPREVQEKRLGVAGKFENVEVGLRLAVYALGIDRADLVAAEACADVTLDGPTGNVTINLQDTADVLGGTFQTEETFDVTAGFHPALDALLDAMRGLSTDAARYVVDLVADHPRTPSWLRSALSSSAVRSTVASLLRDAIGDIHVPGYVTALLDFGGDVDTAFSQLTLRGQLSFTNPDEFGAAMGNHRIYSVAFPLDGTIAERRVAATAPVNVTVGPMITMDEHALGLVFGQVLEMIINDVLLPRLPGSPTSLVELTRGLLDCEAIARSLVGTGSTWTDVADGVCEVGLTLLGGYLEAQLLALGEYDTLHLSGTAQLQDLDRDYDRETINGGMAHARWTGADGEIVFDGTFTGLREDDTRGQRHPVRERMMTTLD